MYEAHRSWQLPGQCGRPSSCLPHAIGFGIRPHCCWRGRSSLRRAVTTRFAAAFATQDAAAIPWSALPALQCPQRSSRHSASCGYWRCAPGRFHAMPVAQSVLAVFGAWRTSRPILGSPWGGRRLLASCPQAELARKYALHQGEEVGYDIAYGAALAARLQLVEYFLAMLRQPPQGGLHVLCWSAWALLRQGGSSPTAMPNGRRLRARGTFFLYIYVLYVLPCSAVMWRACPVCCGTSVLLVESPDNGSGSVASLSCDGVVGANHRHRGIDRGRNGGGFRCLRQRCLNGRPPDPPGCFRGRWRLVEARADWRRVRRLVGRRGRLS